MFRRRAKRKIRKLLKTIRNLIKTLIRNHRSLKKMILKLRKSKKI